MISAGCIDEIADGERHCQLGCEWQLSKERNETLQVAKYPLIHNEVSDNVDKDCVKKEREGGRIVEACMCSKNLCNIATSATLYRMTLTSMAIIYRLA